MESKGPIRSLEVLEEQLGAATDDGARAALRLFARRLVAEMMGDVDAALATVAPTFTFGSRPEGQLPTIENAEGLRAALGLMSVAGVKVLWFDWEHIVADESTVAFAGTQRTVVGGAADQLMLASSQLNGFIEIRDGLMVREVVYPVGAAGPVMEPIAASELPSRDDLVAWSEKFATA
jgi:hypothetical protein